MRLERERDDGGRDFWEATLGKATIEIRSGIVNVKHTNKTKNFKSKQEAVAALDKLAAAKRAQGFGEPIVLGAKFLPAKLPTNPELERAIREDRSDPGAASVYADWLQAQGSPAGELMALAARKLTSKLRVRFDALAKQLVLPGDDFATWQWRHGLWEWLRLENAKDWMDDKFDAVGFANKLFATPFCAALDELRIGILRWDHNREDVPAVIDAAGSYPWAKSLARLRVGDVDDNIDMAHHAVGEIGGVISQAFPQLRELHVHSGAQSWRGGAETFSLAGLALPKLEKLVVETCAMTKERLDPILRAKLPALTHLELWFGGSDRDAGATIDDLAPLLDGKVFPKVTHLGLCNTDFTGELATRLYESKIASRLRHLDLSRGTFDNGYVTDFYVHAKNFKRLEVLDVSDNYLDKRDLRELRGMFTKAKLISTGQPKLEYGEEYRYATVVE